MTAPSPQCQPIAEPVRRIDITWHNGAYYVSIPNWSGGTVVDASDYDALKARVEELEAKTSLVTFNEACKRIEELEAELAQQRQDGIESNRLAADNFRRAKVAEAAQEQFISDLASSVAEVHATERQKEVFKASLRFAITHAKRLAAHRVPHVRDLARG